MAAVDRIAAGWAEARLFGHLLLVCRFGVIALLAGAIVFCFVDQGQDVLVAVVEATAKGRVRPVAGFYGGMLLWAFNCWYWSRVQLYFSFDGEPHCWTPKSGRMPDPLRRQIKFVPRLLGVGPFAAMALALWNVRDAVGQYVAFVVVLVGTIALGVAFFALLVYRRTLFTAAARRIGSGGAGGSVRRMIKSAFDVETELRTDFGRGDLLSKVGLVLLLLGALSTAFFVWSWLAPASVGKWIGLAFLFLFGIGAWLPLGNLLVFFGRRFRLPIMTIVFALAALFSFWVDNHAIRTLPTPAGEAVDPRVASRPDISALLNDWQGRRSGCPTPMASPRPLLIVATAGGGARAAYWTMTALGTMHADSSEFDSNLLAISGVSGGSLGAAVYRAMLEEEAAGNPTLCEHDARVRLKTAGQQVLREDLLTPAVAGVLFPDLAQRFLPVAFLPDRAAALELGWERIWRENIGTERFAESFLGLWRLNEPAPALFLNGTVVETGQRAITSNVLTVGPPFENVIDPLLLGGLDLPLSTAANMSARFPYVEPAGTLRFDCARLDADDRLLTQLDKGLKGRCKQAGATATIDWGHIVDGGYFENFGALTAEEILRASIDNPQTVRPIIIQITSDPELAIPGITAPMATTRAEPGMFVGEIKRPILTFLNTRPARGANSMLSLKRVVEKAGGVFLYFKMCPREKEDDPIPPLGWVLSERASDQIERYVDGCNKDEFDWLARCLNSGACEGEPQYPPKTVQLQ